MNCSLPYYGAATLPFALSAENSSPASFAVTDVSPPGSRSVNNCLDIVRHYAPVIQRLFSMDSLSRELKDYSKNERAFVLAAVLGDENLSRLAPNREPPHWADLLASLRGRADLVQKHGISDARLVDLCQQRMPQLVDIALRNEDITHYESSMRDELLEREPALSASSVAERMYQADGYLDILTRLNVANCRECSNAIAGILSRDNPQLRVVTVASMAHDHQFVLVSTRLPFHLENMHDLEPDTVVVDPWNGDFGLALEAFLASDAFARGYEMSSLRYTNVFYDPLS